jgi:non-ribosomal peptide synthetase component E (peptide arylation enzyme)
MKTQRDLWAGFMQSAERFPERPAVIVEDRTFPYQELREIALAL